MSDDPKPRWDLAGGYFRAGFPVGNRTESFKRELIGIFGEKISNEKIELLMQETIELMAQWMINEEVLDVRNVPTPAEYRATFNDLLEDINRIVPKLVALNQYPFDYKVDYQLYVLLDKHDPDKLTCDFVDKTIEALNLIKVAVNNAIDDLQVKRGRRSESSKAISFLIGLAKIYNKYTGEIPTSYCDGIFHGEYAKLALLCGEKSGIQIPDFCAKIKKAVKAYKDHGNSVD